MSKKRKNTFALHDMDQAKVSAEFIGRDLTLDIRTTIQRIEEREESLSEEAIKKHSPWIHWLREEATRAGISHTDPQFRALIRDSAADFMRWMMFHGYGEQNFRLWPALCEALLATEFRTPRELLKLPYPFMTFQLPRVVGEMLPIRHQDGTSYPASTIYAGVGLGAHTKSSVLTVSVVSEMPKHWLQRRLNGNQYHFMINMDQAPEILDEDWAISHECTSYTLDRDDRQHLRLVLNALLYVSTPAADLIKRESQFEEEVRKLKKNAKIKNKPRQLQRKAELLRRSSMIKHTDAGKKFKLSFLSMDGNTGNHGTAKIRHKFLVRGHWRNQPFGPNREGRKLIWIKPFYKGEGLPEALGRTYEVVQ